MYFPTKLILEEMIKFILIGLTLSEELNVRISHGYTGYLFLSSDKSLECGLDLTQIGTDACLGKFLVLLLAKN